MTHLVLATAAGAICLEWDENEWCQVRLRNDEQIDLGADSLHIVAERIRAAIGNQPQQARWVTSLSEQHHSIYVSTNIDECTLTVEGPDGVVVAVLRLSQHDVQEWTRRLAEIAS